MGDFNTDASEDDGVLRMLADRLDLRIYRPDADDQGTFIKHGTRLDWILISRELRFRNYRVLPEVVSDHLAITADVELSHAD
jgi:endonuclease/exonuclease/phosphatase family metal-dependent hydrolase